MRKICHCCGERPADPDFGKLICAACWRAGHWGKTMKRRDPYTDDTPMPWGPHRGIRMGDVPPEHLDFLLQQTWIKEYVFIYDYLFARKDDIQKRVEEARKARGTEDESVEQTSSFADYMRDYRGF